MPRPLIRLHRKNGNKDQTLGFCNVVDEYFSPIFSSISLERGKRNNQPNISCVKAGTYIVKREWSEKFQKELWEIKEVPGRSECKFHVVNFFRDLNGCVGLGTSPADIDNDGNIDITKSKLTMDEFHRVMAPYKEAVLIITEEPYLKDFE